MLFDSEFGYALKSQKSHINPINDKIMDGFDHSRSL